jgi:hypothetical protein
MQQHKNIQLIFSLLLFALLVVASLVSISDKTFYVKETLNWQAQSIAQDWVDICLVAPVLLATSIFAYRGNKFATAAWSGTLFYLSYTFTIYCFDIHFNKLFIVYCLLLGLSFYLSLYFLLKNYRAAIPSVQKTRAAKMTAWYFIVIALLFYALWLSDIIPAIRNGVVPASTIDVGLPTNAVHVIDLAIFLPAIAITGVAMLRKKAWAFVLAPSFLCFFVLMDITIAVLTLLMYQRGFDVSFAVAIAMIVLAIISLIMYGWFFKSGAIKASNETVSSVSEQSLQ